MRTFLVQHTVGMLAQIAAALPLLLITALLAHTVGLEYSGRFTVTAGLGAFAFSLAGWGLRTHIVIDRLEKFTALEYLVARCLAIVAAVIATLLAGYAVGLPGELVLAVVLFRTCDTLIDLNFAFDLVRRTGGTALNRNALAHAMKVLALIAVGVPGHFLDPRGVNLQIVVAGALVTSGAAIALLVNMRSLETRRLTPATVRNLFAQSKWFASAEISSSGISSAPRISLAWLYSGAALGVVGTSLSIAGFFGMALYTSWLRFLPRFSGTTRKAEAIRSLLLETAAIALLLSAAAWFVLPYLAGFIFGFHELGQIRLSRDVLLASVVFCAGMNVINLYKISRSPWMETASYVLAVLLTVAAAWAVPGLRSTPPLLVLAGAIMFGLSLPNLVGLLTTHQPDPATAPQLAVFARISSRPVPRVARMMQVASDIGYECLFLGAMRENGLPREDRWQGWKTRRIGPAFALLNGTRPLVYAWSVAGYNVALYRVLRQARPALIHCSDCETMPAAIVYCLLNRPRLIFNIHDNIAQRYNVPGFVAVILNLLEGFLVLCSDVTAVPEEFRRSALPRWCRSKIVIIRNTPIDPGRCEPQPVEARIRVFFGGWLDWGRGLRPLMEMAAVSPRIELRIAGEGAPAIIEEIGKNANVVFLGFLDHEQVMAETRRCHFVSAFYDPGRVINRFAASNKIAEALAVGRPILMNSELEIAKELGPWHCAISMPYSDIARSGDQILAFAQDRIAYCAACANARAAYEAGYAWEGVRDKIRAILIDERFDTALHMEPIA